MFEASVQEGYEQFNECVPSPPIELAAPRQVQVCAGEDGRKSRGTGGYGPNYFCQPRCPSVCGQRSQHDHRRVSRGDGTSLWNVRNAGINVQAAFVLVAKQRSPGRVCHPRIDQPALMATPVMRSGYRPRGCLSSRPLSAGQALRTTQVKVTLAVVPSASRARTVHLCVPALASLPLISP
jgi:hypothetical protein